MIYQKLEETLSAQADWALRRQRSIPNNRRLFVLACMDERLPVEEALGIGAGDAHVFRNAGGLVTDDAIRSAMLTTNFFGTEEIIIVNHTECGMMSARTEDLVTALTVEGVDPTTVVLDPSLPELRLSNPSAFGRWIKMFDNVDEAAESQVQLLKSHPLIPSHVQIHAYVYEVETGHLRHPNRRLSDHVNDAKAMIERALPTR